MTENTINDDVTMGGPDGALLAGRYRVVKQLGQGGMGSVWLAEDEKLDGFKVAIKMLPSVLVNNKRAYAQVKAEALVSLKLSHPNIATVRAFEEESGSPFLVMDYIDGQPLDDYLAVKGKLSEDETIRLLKPVAAALDYAHAQGVVHRDVKPGNIMIRKDGTPFVLDFGIAREIQETMTRVTGKLSSGTLLYMSPEQLHGAAPKPAQDIYSFAAMTYECLTGNPPFERGQIEYQIEHDTPEPIPRHIAICSQVMAGLVKDPQKRSACCLQVLSSSSEKGMKPSRDWRLPLLLPLARRVWKPIALLCVIGLVAYGGYQWWDNYVPAPFVEWQWEGQVTVQEANALKLFRAKKMVEGCEAAKDLDSANPEILYYLAECYEHPTVRMCGLQKNAEKAFELRKRAADKGYCPAIAELAVDYAIGYKCEKNIEEADRLIKIAVRSGYPRAYQYLGLSYQVGMWTEANPEKALRYYEIAARKGVLRARASAGEMYCMGQGTKTNTVLGVKYLRQAAKAGDDEAQFALAQAYCYGWWNVERDISKSSELFDQAILNGCIKAWNKKGMMYACQPEFSGSRNEAIRCWIEGANHGDADCALWLGFAYRGLIEELGQAIKVDLREQLKWFRKAQDLAPNIENANFALGQVEEVKKEMVAAGYSRVELMTDEELIKEREEQLKTGKTEAEEAAKNERERIESERKAEQERLIAEEKERKQKEESERARAEEERRNRELEVEMSAARQVIDSAFSTEVRKLDFQSAQSKLREGRRKCKLDESRAILSDAIEQLTEMKAAMRYLRNHVQGFKFAAPYIGVGGEVTDASFMVDRKKGKATISQEILWVDIFNKDKMLSEQLYKGLILPGSSDTIVGSEKWGRLMLGYALLVKHIEDGNQLKNMRIIWVVKNAIDKCGQVQERANKWFAEDKRQVESVEVAPIDPRESYAKSIVNDFSFNIASHFVIHPNLRAQVSKMFVADEFWKSASQAKAKGDVLGVLNALSGRKLETYPERGEIDAIFKNLRQRQLHIAMTFCNKQAYHNIKCFRVVRGYDGLADTEDVSSGDQIDDLQIVVKTSIRDGKTYMMLWHDYSAMTSSFYGTNGCKSKFHILEKKLENRLISKDEYDREVKMLNRDVVDFVNKTMMGLK